MDGECFMGINVVQKQAKHDIFICMLSHLNCNIFPFEHTGDVEN